MSKTITLRLSDEDYQKIAASAKNRRRPISNFIIHVVVDQIEANLYADSIEMAQIQSDPNLLKRLSKGHQDDRNNKGKRVG